MMGDRRKNLDITDNLLFAAGLINSSLFSGIKIANLKDISSDLKNQETPGILNLYYTRRTRD